MFIDESSICPSNFKKKIWKIGKAQQVVISNIKYEKIMLLGCISNDGVEGLVFWDSNMSSNIFNNFIFNVVSNLNEHRNKTKTPIVFMDNASCHRNKLLLKFLKRKNIYCIFNMPGHPRANPIEYFWEYMKREFRRTLTYSK